MPNYERLETASAALFSMSSADRERVGEMLVATAADVALYGDWEFSTLFSVERARLRELAASWHEVIIDDQADVALRVETLDLVANVLTNACGYPGALERIPHAAHASRILVALVGTDPQAT